jgi:hypothetical protein
MIISGQLNRDEALAILEASPYASAQELDSDLRYFLKKMNWDEDRLRDYLSRPKVEHDVYPSEFKFAKTLFGFSHSVRGLAKAFKRNF